MAYINIDKTVENILEKYVSHCQKVLADERRRIESKKYSDLRDRTFDLDMLERARQSLKFLYVVVSDPKKYLYTNNDVINTRLTNGKTVYEMLDGIVGTNIYDPNRVFVRLSEALAFRARSGKKDEVWGYITDGVIDSEADKILKINKYMSLIDANDFVKTFKGLMPEQFFAVSMYDKKQK